MEDIVVVVGDIAVNVGEKPDVVERTTDKLEDEVDSA